MLHSQLKSEADVDQTSRIETEYLKKVDGIEESKELLLKREKGSMSDGRGRWRWEVAEVESEVETVEQEEEDDRSERSKRKGSKVFRALFYLTSSEDLNWANRKNLVENAVVLDFDEVVKRDML